MIVSIGPRVSSNMAAIARETGGAMRVRSAGLVGLVLIVRRDSYQFAEITATILRRRKASSEM